VGFYGPIAPPVPNAPSSRICGQNPRNDADATFRDPHISVINCCGSAGTPPVLTQHATIGGRLPEWQTSKCISSVSFVRIESKIFYKTQETQAQKMMDQNFEIRILSLRFIEIFKKASRGPSAANLDHYGRGQTRSEWGPCDQFSS